MGYPHRVTEEGFDLSVNNDFNTEKSLMLFFFFNSAQVGITWQILLSDCFKEWVEASYPAQSYWEDNFLLEVQFYPWFKSFKLVITHYPTKANK